MESRGRQRNIRNASKAWTMLPFFSPKASSSRPRSAKPFMTGNVQELSAIDTALITKSKRVYTGVLVAVAVNGLKYYSARFISS